MNATSIGKETWKQSGPGVIEITQYGFRLPNGDERWGDLTTELQQVGIQLGVNGRNYPAYPGAINDGLRLLRDHVREFVAAGMLSPDEIEQHLERIVRIERNVMVAIAATTDTREF